ncbi:MAG: LysR substrate-binding domain-containing protein [Microvirga sp.]|nr:LysR substrate-binding domain-containing protein [Microvirga sp.]
MKLNARQLEIFRAVLMIGSVTKAATALGVSQPAVSRALADLERSLGFPLFDRRGGRLSATQDGVLFHEQIEQHFITLDAIERVGASVEALRLGRLRIAAMQSMANGIVPLAVADFARAHKDIPVVLDGRARSWVIERVAAAEVDLGVGTLPVDDAGVDTSVIATLPAVAVLPVDHARAGQSEITAQELAGERFVTFPKSSQFRLHLDTIFRDAEIDREPMIEVHSSEAVAMVVGRRGGVSVTNPFALDLTDDDRIRLIPFAPAYPISLAVLLPAGRTPSRPAEAFIATLREVVAEIWPQAVTDSGSN